MFLLVANICQIIINEKVKDCLFLFPNCKLWQLSAIWTVPFPFWSRLDLQTIQMKLFDTTIHIVAGNHCSLLRAFTVAENFITTCARSSTVKGISITFLWACVPFIVIQVKHIILKKYVAFFTHSSQNSKSFLIFKSLPPSCIKVQTQKSLYSKSDTNNCVWT